MERLFPNFDFNTAYHEVWSTIKLFIVTVFTWFCSILSPIGAVLWILFGAFAMNIFGGILTMRVKGERFSMKKFTEAFLQLVLFGASIAFVHWLGITFKDALLSETGVKWLTYIIILGYGMNIFKNAHIKWPESKTIALIYSILTVEIFKNIKDYIGFKKLKSKNTGENG